MITFSILETHPGEWRMCMQRDNEEIVHLCRGGHTPESAAIAEQNGKRGHHHSSYDDAAACVGANNVKAIILKREK